MEKKAWAWGAVGRNKGKEGLSSTIFHFLNSFLVIAWVALKLVRDLGYRHPGIHNLTLFKSRSGYCWNTNVTIDYRDYYKPVSCLVIVPRMILSQTSAKYIILVLNALDNLGNSHPCARLHLHPSSTTDDYSTIYREALAPIFCNSLYLSMMKSI